MSPCLCMYASLPMQRVAVLVAPGSDEINLEHNYRHIIKYADGAPCLEGLEEVLYFFPREERQSRRFPSYASPIFRNHPVSYITKQIRNCLLCVCGCTTCTLAYVPHRLCTYFSSQDDTEHAMHCVEQQQVINKRIRKMLDS